MGDLIRLLVSVNKISLLAFVVVLFFLIYELRLISRENKKKTMPNIPKFDPNAKVQLPNQVPIIEDKSQSASSRINFNKILAVILFLMLLFFGGKTLSSIITNNTKKTGDSQPKVIIQTISSKGIKIFNDRWEEIGKDKYNTLKPLNKIIIGLETIPEADIDRARIKVNDSNWKTEYITMQFNKKYQIYYREYQIATDEYKLKIEGQLHSKVDGWLGD